MSADRRFHVENAVLDITLRLCDARAFAAYVKPIGVEVSQVKALKRGVMTNFDVGPRLKFAMVWIARRPAVMRDQQKMIDGFARFGLDDSHVEAFDRLRGQQLLTTFVKKAKTSPLDIESADHAQHACGVAIESITEFTKKFAIRKMRFITKSNNEPTIDPILQDLLELASGMFYEITPWLSWAHTINYLKRTVHSRGVNRMKFENTAARKRLIGSPGFHENRIVSLDAMQDRARLAEERFYRVSDDNVSMGESAIRDADGVMAIESPMLYNDIVNTFGKLVHKYAKSPKKQTVVRLLAMHDLPNFVALARQRSGNATLLSTEDVLEELGVATFHELVRDFVRAPKSEFDTFLAKLRNEFEGVK